MPNERGRELQAGRPAEEKIQLPARDTRNIDKSHAKHAQTSNEAVSFAKATPARPTMTASPRPVGGPALQ